MSEIEYEERAENIMPKWSSWGGGLVKIKKLYWYQSRIRIIAILKQLHRSKERIKELEQENRLLRIDVAESLELCIGDDIIAATARLEEVGKDK